MNNLKRIEGKTIKTVSENNDGVNSYFIIKFEEGGKANIVSFLRGDEGVAQLDIDLNGLQPKDLLGMKIVKVEEEFDGELDHLILHLRGGKKLEITPYSSSPVSTASLDVTLYSGDNIVAESLEENMYQKWGEYPLSKPQYENGSEAQTHKNNNFVSITIQYDPKTERDIVNLLNKKFDMAKPFGGVGKDGYKIIDVFGDDATIENVSDVLYKYIENGTVYTVDEI